jgi:hypothetical protein
MFSYEAIAEDFLLRGSAIRLQFYGESNAQNCAMSLA